MIKALLSFFLHPIGIAAVVVMGAVSLAIVWGTTLERIKFSAYVIYAAIFAAPADLFRIRSDGLATLFYVANWHAIFADYDYWALFGAGSPLEHTWSLAIEEQFYLLWPPLVGLSLGLFGRSRHVFALAILALAGLSALRGIGSKRQRSSPVMVS